MNIGTQILNWDGTHAEIPFPPDAVCVDLRYVRTF